MCDVSFLIEYWPKIHESLNLMWSIARELADKFLEVYDKVQFSTANGNYIKIGGKWHLQRYPIPIIKIPIGEVGINLNRVSFVTCIYSKSLTEDFFSELMRLKGLNFEIYGGKDFFKTFYTSGIKQSPSTILENIMKSSEKVVQIEVKRSIDDAYRIIEDINEISKLIKQFRLQYISPNL
jgi:hypothetical protein